MGHIRRVLSDRLWHEVRTLLADGLRDAALLHVYLVTGPAFDFIGAGIFNAAGAAEDLVLSVRRVKTALQVLIAREFVLYDERARIIFVPMILESDPIRGTSQLAGALRRLEGLPDCPLIDRVSTLLSPRAFGGVSPTETPTPSPSPSPVRDDGKLLRDLPSLTAGTANLQAETQHG